MNLFNVYPLFNITPIKAEGSYLWDQNGQKYLDLYGGHAVISIGHSHPYYVQKITNQLSQIGFYSNSVQMPLQQELATKLGELSGYKDYNLFLINSGAEAIENAMKVASFYTGRKKIIYFSKSFHGRTSAAVASTDDASIVAPINQSENFLHCEFNNENQLEQLFHSNSNEIAAVIIEGIQGVGGVQIPNESFFKKIETLCKAYHSLFICDEIQSGYGRTGKFFAHQWANVTPDIITIAKGMGNGFPVAGTLIHPKIEAKYGMLGTTFGGNYLACAASIAVLDVIKNENLIQNAIDMGEYFYNQVKNKTYIKEIRMKGLMIGLELNEPIAEIRKNLVEQYFILTGNASNKNTIRILPALNISKKEIDTFIKALDEVMEKVMIE